MQPIFKSLDSRRTVLGPSIKYVTLFLANFDPPPPDTLCHTHRDPQKYVTDLGPPPIFTRPSKKNPDKSPLYKFSLNCSRVFLSGSLLSGGLLSRRFCPG